MAHLSTDEEVILLKAVTELIDTMVNYEMLELIGTDPECQIRFRSVTHQRFFNVVLVDLLSATDKRGLVSKTTYLSGLLRIANQPSFSVADSVQSLRVSLETFIEWLNREVEVRIWLPAGDVDTILKLSRVNFLKMCGNLAKHNFLRATSVAMDLIEVLSRNGTKLTLESAHSALSDFYERFHKDIVNYHGSTISEFLNNIRWGIYEYLQPEFKRSITWDIAIPTKYSFNIPRSLGSQFAKECYWELMNEMRTPPIIRRFQVTQILKLRY